MKKEKTPITDAEEFVDSVMKNQNVKADDILTKIVRRKVEKHIRKTLRQAGDK